MEMLTEDYRDFLDLLNKHDVRYLVIGAFSVAAHGYPRYTKDIDVLVDVNEENAEKILKVLEDFGFGSLDFKKEDFLGEDIIQLGYEPNRIDILTKIMGIDFQKAYQNKFEFEFDGVRVVTLSKSDLIKAKTASGRDEDLRDVGKLRAKKD